MSITPDELSAWRHERQQAIAEREHAASAFADAQAALRVAQRALIDAETRESLVVKRMPR